MRFDIREIAGAEEAERFLREVERKARIRRIAEAERLRDEQEDQNDEQES